MALSIHDTELVEPQEVVSTELSADVPADAPAELPAESTEVPTEVSTEVSTEESTELPAEASTDLPLSESLIEFLTAQENQTAVVADTSLDEQILHELQVANNLMGINLALMIFFLGLFFLVFFIRIIKNNVTNFFT